jgi:hypothetical protein
LRGQDVFAVVVVAVRLLEDGQSDQAFDYPAVDAFEDSCLYICISISFCSKR